MERIFNDLLKSFGFKCERCFDTGLWLTPLNEVHVCPRIQCGDKHDEPNEASRILKRAADNLKRRQIWANPMAFDLARIICKYTTNEPCRRSVLLEYFFDDTHFSEDYRLRKFHGLIEELQKVWFLPIGARKFEPSYWMITDLEDFKIWLKSATSAPLTRLTTIYQVARANFPVYADQLEMNFLNAEEKADVL